MGVRLAATMITVLFIAEGDVDAKIQAAVQRYWHSLGRNGVVWPGLAQALLSSCQL